MKEQQVCACGEHESCVSPDNPNCARLLRAPQNEAEPQPWRVDISCCGRADGQYFFPTWKEADAFRESYTSGYGVNPQGYSAHESADGHRRAGIITGPQPQPTSEEREEAAKGLDELARRFSDDNMGCDSATCRIAARLLRAPQQQGEPVARPRKQVAWMATFGNNTRIYLGQPPTNERWKAILLYADISAEREE